MNQENPLSELIATHVLNSIALHSNIKSIEDFENLKYDTKLEKIGLTGESLISIIKQFEEALSKINVQGDAYSVKIKTPITDIKSISDLIESIMSSMSDVVTEVSEKE